MSETGPPFDEPVVLPVEDVLDLHSFQPTDIRSVVEEYLEECRRSGILQVRLIHGKGAGVQRAISDLFSINTLL
jgi:DNA-nicking Smr family endonuclease